MELEAIIERLEEEIDIADTEYPDQKHWGLEQGVLITLNDAKIILAKLKEIKNP